MCEGTDKMPVKRFRQRKETPAKPRYPLERVRNFLRDHECAYPLGTIQTELQFSSMGHLYGELHRLVEQGIIQKKSFDSKNYYAHRTHFRPKPKDALHKMTGVELDYPEPKKLSLIERIIRFFFPSPERTITKAEFWKMMTRSAET